MAVTRKTSYALRALCEIAAMGNRKPVNRKMISDKQQISSSYLEHILIELQKSELIKSVRGPGGGFILNKELSEITVWDVFSAVEKSNCVYERFAENEQACHHPENCNVQHVWDDINTVLEKKMTSITLKNIITYNA